jgi:hypothetical protein
MPSPEHQTFTPFHLYQLSTIFNIINVVLGSHLPAIILVQINLLISLLPQNHPDEHKNHCYFQTITACFPTAGT